MYLIHDSVKDFTKKFSKMVLILLNFLLIFGGLTAFGKTTEEGPKSNNVPPHNSVYNIEFYLINPPSSSKWKLMLQFEDVSSNSLGVTQVLASDKQTVCKEIQARTSQQSLVKEISALKNFLNPIQQEFRNHLFYHDLNESAPQDHPSLNDFRNQIAQKVLSEGGFDFEILQGLVAQYKDKLYSLTSNPVQISTGMEAKNVDLKITTLIYVLRFGNITKIHDGLTWYQNWFKNQRDKVKKMAHKQFNKDGQYLFTKMSRSNPHSDSIRYLLSLAHEKNNLINGIPIIPQIVGRLSIPTSTVPTDQSVIKECSGEEVSLMDQKKITPKFLSCHLDGAMDNLFTSISNLTGAKEEDFSFNSNVSLLEFIEFRNLVEEAKYYNYIALENEKKYKNAESRLPPLDLSKYTQLLEQLETLASILGDKSSCENK